MSDAIDIYKCTPRQTRLFIEDIIKAGLVPFIHSSPGMGKSSIVHQTGRDFKLEMIDHRLSTSQPEDLSGLPSFKHDANGHPNEATFVPFDIFPTADKPIPEGKDGWLLFLDEANSASKAVQAASYKLVLDKAVGQHKLHDSVAIVMAGNLAIDKALVSPLSTAMQSRLVHIEMTIDFNNWLEDVAIPNKYDPRIIAFLSYKREYLMDFNPNHHDKTFCCPRTWEFMDKLLKINDVDDKRTPLYAGTITSGVAANFVQFCKVYQSIPDVKAIEADPRNIAVPDGADRRWAVTTHLIDYTTPKNIADLGEYIKRFPLEFRVIYYRSLLIRQPELRSNPDFSQALIEISKYLHEDN